jgi:hypothetical protein
VEFLLALVVMVLTGAIGLISTTGFNFPPDTIGFIMVYSILALGMLISITLAGLCCRRRYGNGRFILLLGLWSIVVCIAGLMGFYLILLSLSGYDVSIWYILFQITIGALVTGVILYVIMLPFMILAFRSEFFYKRLFAYLQLKSMVKSNEQT